MGMLSTALGTRENSFLQNTNTTKNTDSPTTLNSQYLHKYTNEIQSMPKDLA